jgi:RNA polymerase sigma-70 factor (ECF subfamily)
MTEHDQDPDVALMLRVAAGDRNAFEQLVLKYQKTVINIAYRYIGNPSVAEELAQDVFVRVFRAAATYKPEARFSTWLFTIVRNVCSNYRTREGKFDHQMDPDSPALLVLHVQESPEEELVKKERQQKVQDAIESLPDTLRLPLILHQFNQMQYEQIAEVLEISLSAVKVRIYRARQALLEILKGSV